MVSGSGNANLRRADKVPLLLVFSHPAFGVLWAIAPAEVREEAPHFRWLVFSSVAPWHNQPRLMGFFEYRSHDPAWDHPGFGRIVRRTPEVYETIKQKTATYRLVFRIHVPPAVAPFLSTSFHLNGSKDASDPIGNNNVGIGDTRRCERGDFVSAQQLAHHVVLARCAHRS
jgi:hypothetical protein